METVQDILTLLALEQIEENIFRGQNYKTPWKRVFGGQVLAQALHAAYETVPQDRMVHSLHGYFILVGDIDVPVVYTVDRIRDGGSFTTRRVVAIQKGRPIFNLSCSFQNAQDGLDHQIPMPNVPPPEVLVSDEELSTSRRHSRHSRPIEFRPVEKLDSDSPRNASPFRHIWLKAKGEMFDNHRMHQEVLAYTSDYHLLGTSILPHAEELPSAGLFTVSLDHAMWFHRTFRMDEWLLYAMDSPSASNTRGFSRGNIFTQDGILVASVVQEGLMSPRRNK
ncbi:MAG: acyl-CoA thioesterase II [Chloroflexota bacterium]